MVCRLIDFVLAVLNLLMFKVCGILASQKSSLSIFPVLKGLNLNAVLLSDRHFKCKIALWPVRTTFQLVFVN